MDFKLIFVSFDNVKLQINFKIKMESRYLLSTGILVNYLNAIGTYVLLSKSFLINSRYIKRRHLF